MKKLRYVIEAVLLGIILAISKILPVDRASAFGGWIGRTIGPRLAASRKALANIKYAMPETSDEEAKKIVMGMWDNLGRIIMEYPHLRYISTHRTEIINGEILKKCAGKPTIIFSGHLGNWEIMPPSLLLKQNFLTAPIYRAPNNPFVDKMLLNTRSIGGKISPIPKSKTGTRHIVETIQENLNIVMLIDQKYNEGIAVDFFNHPAMTSTLYAQLVQKFDCYLIPLKMERLSGANFRLTLLDPLDTKNKSVEAIMMESHALLESWIRQRPEQWLWLHRRWNSAKVKPPPEGE